MSKLWTQLRGFIYRLVIRILQFFKWFVRSILYIIEWILNIIRRFFLKIKVILVDVLVFIFVAIIVSLSVHYLLYGNLGGSIGFKFNNLVRKTVRKISQFCRFRPTFRPFSGSGRSLGPLPQVVTI